MITHWREQKACHDETPQQRDPDQRIGATRGHSVCPVSMLSWTECSRGGETSFV
jgi:hypothetical protein